MSYDDDNDSDLVKDLRAQIKAKDKELAAKTSQVEDLQKYKTKVTVDDVIEKQGLNPKIKALIPKDVEDVSAWLEEFGELFGAPAPPEDATGDDAGVAGEVEELDRQNDSEGQGADDSGLLAKIAATTDMAELKALIGGG